MPQQRHHHQQEEKQERRRQAEDESDGSTHGRRRLPRQEAPPAPPTPRELESRAQRLEQRVRRAHEAAAKWRLLCLQAEGERDELRQRLGDGGEEGGKPGSPICRGDPLSPWRTNSRTSLRFDRDEPEPRVAPARGGDTREPTGCIAPVGCENDDAAKSTSSAVVGSPTRLRDSQQKKDGPTDAQRAEMLQAECAELRERCSALAARVEAQAQAVASAEESAEAAELECASLRRAGERTQEPGRSVETGSSERSEWARRTELQQQRIGMHLMQRCTSRLLREICTAWCEHSHVRARCRNVVRRALSARGRRGVGACFYGWAEGARCQRLQRRAVTNRLQSRQRSGVARAFRSWLAEITRVRDKQLRRSSTLVWDRHEKAREGLLGRVAKNLARVTNAKSTRACFSSWSALVRDSGGGRWRKQHGLYAARRLQRWKLAMAFRRWERAATYAYSKRLATASDSVSQQYASAAESQELLAHAEERLAQMKQRVRDAEEAAAAAEQHAAAQQQQIRKLQKRLKAMTLTNGEQAESLRRLHAQREISFHR